MGESLSGGPFAREARTEVITCISIPWDIGKSAAISYFGTSF